MPIQVSYPGVYVQEVAGGQPTVAGVSTSSTAFVDFFARGPMHKAVRAQGLDEAERTFGGLHAKSEASYALRQYFLNGGAEAWIIRSGDGSARRSFFDVRVKTPGLAARFQWANEYADLADKAQEAAHAAAEAANEALQGLQGEGVTDQQREQGLSTLHSRSGESASQTEEASRKTRLAAEQAKASSDELAIAIAALKAASGPGASRTVSAARQSARAAKAASEAAQTTTEMIAAAQQAADAAGHALRAAQAARSAANAAGNIQTVLESIGDVQKADETATSKNEQAQAASDKTVAEQAAVQAAQAAESAAEEAEAAVDALCSAAASVVDHLKLAEASDDDIKAATENVTAAEAIRDEVEQAYKNASEAAWDAQTALTLEDAQAAATKAAETSKSLLELLRGAEGDDAGGKVTNIATTALKTVLDMAATAAENGAAIADKEAAGDDAPTPTGAVVEKAIGALNTAGDAAKTAAVAVKKAAEDAKVAAGTVGSAAVALASKKALANAHKAGQRTAETMKSAKATSLQINQANMTAIESVEPAKKAAENAKTAGGALKMVDADAVKTALDTAQAALNAGNNALAAAEAVEKGSVEISKVTVETTRSADAAADAARVAVMANEEASRPPTLRIHAANEGVWGDNIQIKIAVQGASFTVEVNEVVSERGTTRLVTSEFYSLLNLEAEDNHNAVTILNDQSKLVELDYIGPLVSGAYPEEIDGKFLAGGDDGDVPDADQLTGASGALSALDDIEPFIFNLLCLPAVANMPGGQASVAMANAHAYCKKKRAFFIADIPASVDTVDKVLEWASDYQSADAYCMATYFPRLVVPDPLQDYREKNVGASGTMAGIYARTDTDVGIWKAPAGIAAVLRGAQVAVKLNDDKNGILNPLGINVLRSFPIYGNISWGGRTLAGADALQSEWKYINVRRLMSYIEESLYQSLKWAVFEPNDEILWGKIRVQVASFLQRLFSDGAFQGSDPGSAFFVQCDGSTTSPVDIDMGVVNVRVGVAPVKPAEFIVLQVQQMAGQSA